MGAVHAAPGYAKIVGYNKISQLKCSPESSDSNNNKYYPISPDSLECLKESINPPGAEGNRTKGNWVQLIHCGFFAMYKGGEGIPRHTNTYTKKFLSGAVVVSVSMNRNKVGDIVNVAQHAK